MLRDRFCRWTLATVVLLGGCPEKTPPTPAASGGQVTLVVEDTVPPPVLQVPTSPLGQAPLSVPGAPELPPLSGALVDIDFVTLNTTTQTFTIDSDTAMFPVVDPRVGFRLQAALEFDPRWRVGLWEGQTAAWPRGADKLGWGAPWGGYYKVQGVTSRSLLRFDKRADDHPWSASGLVAHNAAATKSMKVRGWKVDDGAWAGQMAASFTIDGAAVSFEMHEIAGQLTLSASQGALQRVTQRAKAIAGQLGGGNLQRHSLAMVPPDEPRLGEPFIEIRRAADASSIDIRGRLNPGSAGWIWVRIIDRDGRLWAEEVLAQATAERIGWDTNPEVVSYFQSMVPTASVAPASGTAEVWFQGDDGAPIRQALSIPFVIDDPVEGLKVPAQ